MMMSAEDGVAVSARRRTSAGPEEAELRGTAGNAASRIGVGRAAYGSASVGPIEGLRMIGKFNSIKTDS